MAPVAECRLVSVSKLAELVNNAEVKVEKKLFTSKRIDSYPAFLEAHSKLVQVSENPGYIFAELAVFLTESKGIALIKGNYNDVANAISARRANSVMIFTFEHRQAYVDRLNPDQFTVEELIEFNKEFSGNEDPALAEVQLEGIRALRFYLQQINNETEVALLSIG